MDYMVAVTPVTVLGISRKTQSVPPARKDTGLSVSFCRAIL